MSEIEFSFIIPHKNCPDLLSRCVDSIPYREDIQIIVVDDNSFIDKKPIIKRKNVDVILLDKDQSKGAGRARNIGLERSKGKWLLFADADDFFVTQNLDAKLDQYKNTDADIIFFNVEKVDSDTSEVSMKYSNRRSNLVSKRSWCNINSLRYRTFQPWGKMIRQSLVLSNDIKFSEVISSNDSFFSVVTGYFANKIIIDSEVIYIWEFRHSGNISSNRTIDAWNSRLFEAQKRNKFLLGNGVLLWIRNLYVVFYEGFRKSGISRAETFIKLSKCTPCWLIIPHLAWFGVLLIAKLIYRLMKSDSNTQG